MGFGAGFWVQGVGVLGLVLKVLCFGLRFFGVWAWGLGFGYIKRFFCLGTGFGIMVFSKTKNNFIKIFKNPVKSVYKIGCK